MKEQTCHQFLLQHSAYADVLEKTHSKETEWAKNHKPYEKATPIRIRKKFTANDIMYRFRCPVCGMERYAINCKEDNNDNHQ